jgi:hypothetical protein
MAIDTFYYHRPTSLNTYGGMPSGHSALFASLTTLAGLTQGFDSFLFALSFFFYLVIIRDAAGIRQQLGKQGKMLGDLLTEHAKDHHHSIPHDLIVTRLGHTPWQIAVGSLCGVVFTLLQYAAYY